MSLRDTRLDNIKGGLILLVIFGHLIEPLLDYMPVLSRIYDFIYLFHIPAFVLVSGYVSNPYNPVKYSALLKTIVVPFIVFSAIYEVSDLIHEGEASSYLKSLSPNWILWFLFSLMLWRVFTPLFLKIRYSLFLLILLSIGISLFDIDGYTFGIFRTIIFFPFYIFGAMLSKYKESFARYELNPGFYLASLLILLCLFLWDLPFDRGMLYGSAPFSAFGYSNGTGILQRICYYPVSMLAVFSFSIMVSKINLLNKLGSRSLYVYLLHGLIVKYVIWPYVSAESWSTERIIFLALVATLVLGVTLSSQAVTRITSKVFDAFQSLIMKKQFI